MDSFPIAEAGRSPYWVLLPVLLVLIGVGALIGFTLWGARSARFELSAEGLRLRGDLYGRLIPPEQLDLEGAHRLGPEDTALLPRLRTLGTGLPGYQAGWFRLGNGQKALVYLTDRSRAVYVPTRAGYSLLLSPADPDAFLGALAQLKR
ncbi:MAG TPA: PH domain-containing protein [Polyangiaceae bacterium]|nr:PH domain-containing protein [Polyangiaceae bacterium]